MRMTEWDRAYLNLKRLPASQFPDFKPDNRAIVQSDQLAKWLVLTCLLVGGVAFVANLLGVFK